MADAWNKTGCPIDRRARKWRALTASAGLVLAAAFFMPAVRGCQEPVVPAHETNEAVQTIVTSSAEMAIADLLGQAFGIYSIYVAAYLFGALAGIGALARLWRSRAAQNVCAFLQALMLFSLAAGVFMIGCHEFVRSGSLSWMAWSGAWTLWHPALTVVFLPVWILLYVVFSRWLKGRAYLCHLFVGSLYAAIWFSYWSIAGALDNDAYYGVHVSFAASCVLVISAIGEASTVTWRRFGRTLWRLLTFRLEPPAVGIGHCPRCDYHLFGLTEKRCPECGRVFTFKELGVLPETIGFAGAESPD